ARIGNGERPLATKPSLSVFAGEHLHHDVRGGLFTDVIDADAVLALNAGGAPSFADEAAARSGIVRVVGVKELHRDGRIEREVMAGVNDTHATLAEALA